MDLKVLAELAIPFEGTTRSISLCEGDLANLSAEDAADILVVSAFAGDYTPVPGTLIGALDRRGLSVSALAAGRVAMDLREGTTCWVSEELLQPGDPALNIRRLLCFEPGLKGQPPEVVGDIFRALMTFSASLPPGGQPLKVAMPIVASGNQRVPMVEILRPLIQAAARWMSAGAPLGSLRIVTLPNRRAEAERAFLLVIPAIDIEPPATGDIQPYDAFISYTRIDANAVDRIVERLSAAGARIFVDRLSIQPGASWQQEVWDALAHCRTVVTVFSPEYLQSKICLEEYAIAMLRRRTGDSSLVPIYLRTARLPAQMQIVNLVNCLEGTDDAVDRQMASIIKMVCGSAPTTPPRATRSPALASLPQYVPEDGAWTRAANDWVELRRDRYVEANGDKIEAIMRDPEAGARMLMNLGDYALLRVLDGGKYLNRYEVADLLGVAPPNDGVRDKVDSLIGFPGQAASHLHFGAVGLESAGVRFYGAYALALEMSNELEAAQLFERDSYELVFAPLAGAGPTVDAERVVALRGIWSRDLAGMALLKARALLPDAGRLVTEGRIRDALLRGEEFIEVHFVCEIDLEKVAEVRQAPVEVAQEARLRTAYQRGVLPRIEELVWLARRSEIERRLAQKGKSTRVVDAEISR